MSMSREVRDQFRGYRHPFVYGIHFYCGIGDYPHTLVELAMAQFSAELRRISDWQKARLDPDVRIEWAQMGRERTWYVRTPSNDGVSITLSEKQIEYVLDELEGYAALHDRRNNCQVSSFERIWESSLPPSSRLVNTLSSTLALLRDAKENSADGQHIYLIDPSSHSFVYNRSLVRDGRFDSNPQFRRLSAPTGGDLYTLCTHSAFLPTPVSISSGKATFTSYINNLHPNTHRPLYDALESLLTHFIPLFEHVLTDLHRMNPLYQRISSGPQYTVWDEPEEPVHSDDEEGWERYEADWKHWAAHRPIELPDIPPGGYQGGREERREYVSLKGREVGVVVGIEDIRLEPGSEGFDGEKWHVEGMRNERIVACGIYFADVENIQRPTLRFRMATTFPRSFSAGDVGAALRTWGLHDGDFSHQYLPSRPIIPHLCVAHPNIYQTSISSFSLIDPSLPGRLTLIRFALVDPEFSPPTSNPHVYIPTTREVAPQQESWTREALDAVLSARGLPWEIGELVMEEVRRDGGVMTEEEVKEHRSRLRNAREVFRLKNDLFYFCIPFDVWSAPELRL